jgi:hypothetical protein
VRPCRCGMPTARRIRHALPSPSNASATDYKGSRNHHHAETLRVQVDAHMRRHAAAQGTHVCMLPTTTCAVVLPVWRHLQIRSHCPTKPQPLGSPCQVKQHASACKRKPITAHAMTYANTHD